MKNVLLPTDFSVNSRNAIQYALELFKGTSVCFYFLNVQKTSDFVMDDLMTAEPGSSVHHAILKDNKEKLQEFVSPLKEKYSSENYEFRSYVDYDNLTASINQMIEAETIDLIVMGTNGATGASEVLFGSNTLKIIRKIDCPLLVIPQDYAFKKITTVMFSTYSCDDLGHDNAEPLIDLLDLTGAHLQVLKLKAAGDPVIANECDDYLADALKGHDYTFHSLSGLAGHAAVSAFVQLMKSDVHALFIERETFLDRFFHGNNTAKISYGTRIPLLVLHK